MYLSTNMCPNKGCFFRYVICDYAFLELVLLKQRFQIKQIYYQNSGLLWAFHGALRSIFGRYNRPTESVV